MSQHWRQSILCHSTAYMTFQLPTPIHVPARIVPECLSS